MNHILNSSQRLQSAKQTIQDQQELLADLGIFHSFFVTHPTSHVHITRVMRQKNIFGYFCSGKGFTCSDAEASGLMEAIEVSLIEGQGMKYMKPIQSEQIGIFHAIKAKPLNKQKRLIPQPHNQGFIHGKDLITEAPVSTYYSHLIHQEGSDVLPDMNGIASGNTLEEATLSALLEYIERHHMLTGQRSKIDRRKLLSKFKHLDVIRRELEHQRVEMNFFHLGSLGGIHTFEAKLIHADKASVSGWGSHLNPIIGLNRAISESIQVSSLLRNMQENTLLSSKENNYNLIAHLESSHTDKLTKDFGRLSTRIESEQNDLSFHALFKKSPITNSSSQDLKLCIDGLTNAGVKSILQFELTTSCSAVVVKIHLPNMPAIIL
jgi:YcaO-like protein with predicted kinase domain